MEYAGAMKRTVKRPRIETTLDKARVIFDGDRDLRAAILERKDLANLRDEAEVPAPTTPLPPSLLGMPPPREDRRQLLKTAVRLTPGLAPSVWKCVEHCRKVLGISAPIDVFVLQDSQLNAFVVPPEDGRLVMGITSASIEKLTDAELTSVIGHELGHVLFDHFELYPLLAFEADERLAPIDAMRIYAWMRYAELTADRVGLICCDDYGVALAAEFKIASGLSDPKHLGDVREAALQYTALAAEKLEESDQDWFATHPYSPLRIRALDLFHQSTTFAKLRGKSGGKYSEAELEREVAAIMELMNPAVLSQRGPCKDEVREFLALAAVEVAAADGRIKEAEVQAARRLAGEGQLVDSVEQILRWSGKQREARLRELAEPLTMHLSGVRRRKLIEDLCAIALADKKLDDSEVDTLCALAGILMVDPMAVDAALGMGAKALD